MSKLLSPLSEGDLVDIVSPGSGSRQEDVQLAIELLQSWGLKTRLPAETFAKHAFHSNEDDVRLKLLKKALTAKDSKAVWCLRGGYGANRLMPELWNMKAPAHKKILIGYSDITSLSIWLTQKWKWPVYHGPLLETLISGRLSIEQIEECRQVLFGEKSEVEFSLTALNPAAQKLKKIKAPVTGGNLVVIQTALGTPYKINLKGKILALEEVGERGYRIDRMLEQLEQSGTLRGCKAIVLGEFLYGDERDGSNYVQYALDRFVKLTKIPCFSGLEIGHGDLNRCLTLGTPSILQGGKSAFLNVPTFIAKGAKK